MFATTVILADSCRSEAETLCELVSSIQDCIPEHVESVAEAADFAQYGGVGLAILRINDAKDEAQTIRFMETVAKVPKPIPVIVLGGRDDLALRLKLSRLGVVDHMLSPLNISRLKLLIDLLTVAPRSRRPDISSDWTPCPENVPDRVDGFLVGDPLMRELLNEAKAVASLETTILLTGETGTGKTHLARTIHGLSPRKEKPFQVVHCNALSPTLVESELFGHVQGAFTGADRDRVGKFAEAKDGTLLLDDVNCVPLAIQGKLLRAVEERVFEPVGSNRLEKCRARLIATTNQSLADQVATGKFRSDLYYRLAVVELDVPPLRDHGRSIRPLAQQFLADFSRQHGRGMQGMSGKALALLEAFDWPGNIRELRNVIERAVALHPGKAIAAEHLPEAIRHARPTFGHLAKKRRTTSKSGSLLEKADSEMDRILQALDRFDNNRTLAALELGISRGTLYRKMRRLGLS
jgi:DNA-binding NtrC family response regulator